MEQVHHALSSLISCQFTTVVDGTELGQVYPIQLKPLKYVYHEDEEAMGATMAIMKDIAIYIHIP